MSIESQKLWRKLHLEKTREYLRGWRQRNYEKVKQRWTEQNSSPKWKEYKRQHYLKYKKIQQPIAAERRKIVRDTINSHKNVPCTDCGKCYPSYVMDFDHVRGIKVKPVGSMLNQTRLDKVLDEIAKCEVVCSNCHRERTHKRKSGLCAGNPVLALQIELRRISHNALRGQHRKNPNQICALVIKAWDLFARGRSISRLKWHAH